MQNSKNSLFAIITILIGGMVCIGWLAKLLVLTSIVPDLPSLKFNIALSFILLGTTTYLLTIDQYPRLQLVFITVIVSYCTISLIQDIAAMELHIDELFVRHTHVLNGSRPGRIAQSTEVCSVMISIVLLAMCKSVFHLVHQVIIHLAALISFIAIIGYLLNVPLLYNYSLFTSISIHSALLIFMNSINISFLNPNIGMMKYFSSDRIGNKTIFRLFSRLVIAVVGLSVAELALHKKGLVTDEVGSALFTLSFIVIGFLLI